MVVTDSIRSNGEQNDISNLVVNGGGGEYHGKDSFAESLQSFLKVLVISCKV